MRSISNFLKECPKELPQECGSSNVAECSLDLKLETPLFGGGIAKGEFDKDRPIRVPSIRGHLRFWWRMIYGGQLSGGALRDAEGKIWGATEIPSPVSVSVTVKSASGAQRYANDDHGFEKYGPESYALFSAKNNKQDILKEGLVFSLTLRAPQCAMTSVLYAVAAWVYFGGIGSRTRRGLGTLSCENPEKLPPVSDVLREARQNGASLAVYRKTSKDMLSAWKSVLSAYKEYRQTGRDARPAPRARSRWPEPDTIRYKLATKQCLPRHAEPVIEKSAMPSFPRAALGLPIIFHFMHREIVPDVELVGKRNGKSIQRMGSPVITKALKEGENCYGAVIVLPHAEALKILPYIKSKNYQTPQNTLGMSSQKYEKVKPMQGCTDAISGFEKYITQKKNFEKVK